MRRILGGSDQMLRVPQIGVIIVKIKLLNKIELHKINTVN